MSRKIKIILWFIGTYITIVGVVTFSQFIMEEAIQTAIWGTWPAQDAKQWHLVKDGIAVIDSINTTLKYVTYCFGWVQPLAMIGYIKYVQATEYYIQGLKAKTFANAPELYIGEKVKFTFHPRKILGATEGKLAVNGKIGVYLKDHAQAFSKKLFGAVIIEGTVFHEGNMLIIR
jgi:hypothetical protein